MKNYKVNIDFKRGPSFSTDVCAMSEQSAQVAARKLAVDFGFDAPVKKVTVTEEVTA